MIHIQTSAYYPNMNDSDRHFTYPPRARQTETCNRGNECYQRHISSLTKRCWDYYEHSHCQRSEFRHRRPKSSLYTGSLGPCSYLRYQFATSPCFSELDFTSQSESSHGEGKETKATKYRIDASGGTPPPSVTSASSKVQRARWQMLVDARSSADTVHRQHRQEKDSIEQRVTLLEGELVGALAMKIVIGNAMLDLIDNGVDIPNHTDFSEIKDEVECCKMQLLQFGESHVLSSLHPSECEVLYGRAGYLKAIQFVRREISDDSYGQEMVRHVLAQIWNEGKRGAAEERRLHANHDDGMTSLPLVWKWHSKLYLGAAHGIVGILHTLLDFEDELTSIDGNALIIIEATVLKLNEYCFKSGNLQSSIASASGITGNMKKTDRLVQFCHGAPGHILLLVHFFRNKLLGDRHQLRLEQKHHLIHKTCHPSQGTPKSASMTAHHYQIKAQQIAECVLLPRGLLRKGVGLCHGISGNAFCFMAIYDAAILDMKMTMPSKLKSKNTFGGTTSKSNTTATTSDSDAEKWLGYTYNYVNAALDNLVDLERIPDRPYSLYEGLGGLICLLLNLIERDDDAGPRVDGQFPCFAF